MNTNLLTLLLTLWQNQPTNTLPPIAVPIICQTNTVARTNWVLTGNWKVESGVRKSEWLRDSFQTNTERQTVTAVIYFRTNVQVMASTRVSDTNETKWELQLPPLPGILGRQ